MKFLKFSQVRVGRGAAYQASGVKKTAVVCRSPPDRGVLRQAARESGLLAVEAGWRGGSASAVVQCLLSGETGGEPIDFRELTGGASELTACRE